MADRVPDAILVRPPNGLLPRREGPSVFRELLRRLTGLPSLGELLQQGKANLEAPWLGLTAFFVLATMLSLLIFVGEAVRDAFDPRKTIG